MADYPVALNPAQEDPDSILDMNTAVGFKMYKHSTRAILETEKYDLSSAKLQIFLDNIKDRIEEQQWGHIFSIPKLPSGNQAFSIATHFGRLTYEDVIQHDTDIKMMTGIPEDDYFNARYAQNSAFSYTAIFSSLTDVAKQRLSHSRPLFIIDGKGSGPLLLFVIISKAYVVNKGTCLHLRQKLQQLGVKMTELDDNIITFNEYVQETIAQLNSFGENAYEDLLANLFTGYGEVEDDSFADWLTRKRNQYEEDDINTLTPEKLMAAAELKYSTLLDQGTWGKPSKSNSKRDAHIIALQATINDMKTAPKPKWGEKGKTSPIKAHANTKWGYKKTPKKTRPGEKYTDAWLFVAPKDGEKETIEKDNCTWHWCRYHEKWGKNAGHTSEKCTGRGLTDKQKEKFDKAERTPGLRIKQAQQNAKAYRATMEIDSESEQSTD
jgi:hypothetical protein